MRRIRNIAVVLFTLLTSVGFGQEEAEKHRYLGIGMNYGVYQEWGPRNQFVMTVNPVPNARMQFQLAKIGSQWFVDGSVYGVYPQGPLRTFLGIGFHGGTDFRGPVFSLPVLGAEYMFNNRFSVGAEVEFRLDIDDNYFENKDDRWHQTETQTLFYFRFYPV